MQANCNYEKSAGTIKLLSVKHDKLLIKSYTVIYSALSSISTDIIMEVTLTNNKISIRIYK